jgi:hypothetical protein
MLREDNGIGVLKEGGDKGAVIIRFPGREEAEEKFPYVREHGSVDGIVAWIGGTGVNQAVRATRRSHDAIQARYPLILGGGG